MHRQLLAQPPNIGDEGCLADAQVSGALAQAQVMPAVRQEVEKPLARRVLVPTLLAHRVLGRREHAAD
eukprot:1386168-Prymnesium_polylepis.1